MFQFRENLTRRQATKLDLVDMAKALGAAADDRQALDQVRALIRGKLPAAELDTSRQASKVDLLGIARALGCDLHSRPKGERMPTEELRAWIQTMLIERGQGSPRAGDVRAFDVFVMDPRTGRADGFVQHTRGGLWRGYSYSRHCGVGPFPTVFAAMVWVKSGACSFLGNITLQTEP